MGGSKSSICIRIEIPSSLPKPPRDPRFGFPPNIGSVVLVHGCFWHQHEGCARATMPKSHNEFWGKKLRRNIERDRTTVEKLKAEGWKVEIIWECESKNVDVLNQRLVDIFALTNSPGLNCGGHL